MNKRWAIILTLLFFLPLAGLGVIFFTGGDSEFSERENRALEQRPPFSAGDLFSGRWTEGFEGYYSDQFPHRDRFMRLMEEVNRRMYVTLRDGSAVIGGDLDLGGGAALIDSGGNYFLITGGRVIHMAEADYELITRYSAIPGMMREAMPGRRVISMIIPTGFPFYAPGAYMQDSRDQKSAIEHLYSLLDSRVVTVDVYPHIEAFKDEYLYFRSDHHWTARGAYRAYIAFCEALGLDPCDVGSWESGQYEGFIGFFYRQVQQHPQAASVSDNPDTVEFFIPPTEHTAVAYGSALMEGGKEILVVDSGLPEGTVNLYSAFTQGDHPLIHIQTGTNNGKSVAVIKESFANAFIPYLLAHYQDIFVIDFRNFNRENQPVLNLAGFAAEHDIGDILIINYFTVPNRQDLTEWLGLLTD
jgi:hypothetical protein